MNFASSITLMFKDAFSSGFTQAKNSLAGMSGALGEINNNQSMNRLAADLAMATSLTDPFRQKLSALMDEPSKLGGQFGSSMRNIQSLTGETNAELAETSKRILEIGGKSVAGPNAAADAFYNIASGVQNASVRFDMLTAATALSEAGQADLQAATSGLISVVNAYNTPAEGMTALSDVFFNTVKMGVGSLDGFVSAMSSVSGLSASVGIGFDELGSAMAFVTAKGQTESVAATQLKAAMVSLLRPNDTLTKALQSVGISSGSAMLEQYGLAESLNIVKNAVGGSQDQMAKALGSVEALQGAIVLTGEDYTAFAKNYAGGLSGATAGALEAQAQSYEARVAKLQAANDALKIQIGDDINSIKGFFVDMGTGFLTNVVSPIMGSPVGEVFQGIAAGVGLAAKGILDLGSGALNTASQLVMLTATMQNAGGFSKLFSNSLSLIKSPFKMISSVALKAVPALGAFAVAAWGAIAPLLPVIGPIVAAVAALAIGGVLLYKNWERVKAFFVDVFVKIQGVLAGMSNKVLAAVAVFVPFIGIPALIIKNWEVIKAFFVGLWIRIVNFAKWAWDGIVSGAVAVANFFSGVWGAVLNWFANAWVNISTFFISIWDGIKNVILNFVAWLQPVIDVIIAPFKAIGNAIDGIFNKFSGSKAGGWLSDTVNMGKTALAENTAQKDAAAMPLAGTSATETAAVTVPAAGGAIIAPATFTATSIAPPPDLGGTAGGATGTGSGKSAALSEHLAAASRKGIAGGEISTSASAAFFGAGGAALPVLDTAELDKQAAVTFQAAMPAQSAESVAPKPERQAVAEKSGDRVFNIQNINLSADDIHSLIDIARIFELAVMRPAEAGV